MATGARRSASWFVGDAGCAGPVFDGAELDGGRHDGFELLVGSSLPFESAVVDDEDVDLAVPDGLFSLGEVCVVVNACLRADRVALAVDRRAERRGRGADEPDVLRFAGLDQAGERDRGDDGHDHDHEGGQEGAGAAAFPQLAFGDEPSLPKAVHAATAWRNSSDSVGGWYWKLSTTAVLSTCAAISEMSMAR